MAPLKWTAAVLALAAPVPISAQSTAASSAGQPASTVATWRPYIREASLRFGVPVAWIERVMQAESRGRTTQGGRPIRSSAGAIGLMQVMPATWSDMRTRLGLGVDPDDPRDNILAGTFYLRLMYDRFGYPGLFAAYNAGPARYADYLAGRASLPRETVGYLASVAPDTQESDRVPATARPVEGLFAVRKIPASPPSDRLDAQPKGSLFVALSQEQ
ncbi:lytic transglycosylase domain-containing protein [Sphingobium yanoikuyae]|jgi:soluble lytic murein transglycosylase-like protein|uniref:lytic transglycosylase domain-containing protein n=1 Tax=Sphingobium yanoikuyae TaxID=13690 RepID=UPI00241003C2|nr:lytic transglycosylase domain-containing protein [Sphingobium yanoikuyae]MDG2515661.1 lytic transglycosylase domain-containing protein [Sphingobium yanoikuyae]